MNRTLQMVSIADEGAWMLSLTNKQNIILKNAKLKLSLKRQKSKPAK